MNLSASNLFIFSAVVVQINFFALRIVKCYNSVLKHYRQCEIIKRSWEIVVQTTLVLLKLSHTNSECVVSKYG